MSCRDLGAVGGFRRAPRRGERRAHRNYCVPIPPVSSSVAVVTGSHVLMPSASAARRGHAGNARWGMRGALSPEAESATLQLCPMSSTSR